MTAYKCDRCGIFYDKYGNIPNQNRAFQPNSFRFIFNVKGDTVHSGNIIDLCPGCVTMLNDWLNGLKQTEEEKDNADTDT